MGQSASSLKLSSRQLYLIINIAFENRILRYLINNTLNCILITVLTTNKDLRFETKIVIIESIYILYSIYILNSEIIHNTIQNN